MGCGVLLIEHNVGLVLNLCDHIVVLDSGEVIEIGQPRPDQRQRKGAPCLYGHAGRCRRCGAMSLLAVDNITVRYGQLDGGAQGLHHGRGRDAVHHRAERGGQIHLAQGHRRGDAARRRITFNDQDITGKAPEDIARQGLSMVPEGRDVFGGLTIEENLRSAPACGPTRTRWRAIWSRSIALPDPEGTQGQACGRAVRRPAADAGDRPCADDQPPPHRH